MNGACSADPEQDWQLYLNDDTSLLKVNITHRHTLIERTVCQGGSAVMCNWNRTPPTNMYKLAMTTSLDPPPRIYFEIGENKTEILFGSKQKSNCQTFQFDNLLNKTQPPQHTHTKLTLERRKSRPQPYVLEGNRGILSREVLWFVCLGVDKVRVESLGCWHNWAFQFSARGATSLFLGLGALYYPVVAKIFSNLLPCRSLWNENMAHRQ